MDCISDIFAHTLVVITHPQHPHSLSEWLIPALVGNFEESLEMCLMDEELRSVAMEAESPGWAFVNEGTAEKPKVTGP